jgi:protein-S-isoprenylcysteine O-methyltransferase Ste14
MEEQNEMTKARPEEIPEATYHPFLLAVSVLFIGWGLISFWVISVAGAIGFFIALAGWIKEMIYDRTER